MNRRRELALYLRFALGLPRFLRLRMTREEAELRVRRALACRAESLLETLRASVFEHPSSPYRALLRHAGCELGDVAEGLRRDGVEATLARLAEAGVRVSYEEFKGRAPIVRGSLRLDPEEVDFVCPRVRAAFPARSSGTTGPAARSYHDLDHLLESVPYRLLAEAAHGLLEAPLALWLAGPPNVAGLNMSLSSTVIGNPPERWWTPLDGAALHVPARHRAALAALRALGRWSGVDLPAPVPESLERPDAIVDWAAGAISRAGACEVRAFTSSALRLARRASERGVDLSGAVLVCGGEAASPAKERVVRASGARLVSFYAITEAGPIGVTCPGADDARDLHLASDRLAVIARPLAVDDWQLGLRALHLTLLRTGGPTVLLNVESDDCGELDAGAACDCLLHRVGLQRRLREVQSFRRLTAEGVTLAHARAVRVLEELLPARFGGTALDYQLAEGEAPDGRTRIVLRIDPSVALPDDEAVVRETLAALGGADSGSALAAAFWRRAGTLELVRERPRRTAGGKLLPILVGPLTRRRFQREAEEEHPAAGVVRS